MPANLAENSTPLIVRLTTWRGRKSFEADLFASYRASGLQEGKIVVPLGATLIKGEESKNIPKIPKKVAIGLSVLDDLMLDAIVWHQSLTMALRDEQSAFEHDFLRSLVALFMRVTQDAMVVRNLIRAGFDVHAKSILRSVDEHVDALYFLCIQPSASAEFVRADDDESANRFWWKHLRNSRKAINKALLEIIKQDTYVKEIVEFRQSERATLSSAHHPSYAACTVPFMVPYRSVNVSRHMFGLPSEASIRTGKLLFFVLAETALFTYSLNADMRRFIDRDNDPRFKFIKSGRQHLARMLLLLVYNWDCRLFVMSKQFEAFLKRVPKTWDDASF